MKNRLFVTSIIAAAVSVAAASSWAEDPACETTFNYRGADNSWQNPDNWDFRVPTVDDVACIPSGQVAKIPPGLCDGGSRDKKGCITDVGCPGGGTCDLDPHQVAEAIVVDGILSLNTYTSLTISADSTLDGDLRVDAEGTFRIDESLTITGDGGELTAVLEKCEFGPPTMDYVKKCVGGGSDGDPCNIHGDCPGGTCTAPTLTTEGVGSTQGTSLVVNGRWQIDVALENNAYVVADGTESTMPLILRDRAKSGSGSWIVEPDCVLQVDTTVTGSGTWEIPYSGKIVINSDCTSLSGDVTITGGTLELNDDFDTTGDLEMSAGTINVAEGKEAEFD